MMEHGYIDHGMITGITQQIVSSDSMTMELFATIEISRKRTCNVSEKNGEKSFRYVCEF